MPVERWCKAPINSPEQKYSLLCNLLPSVQLQENQAVPVKDEEENQAGTVAAVKRWVKRGTLRQLRFTLSNVSIRKKIGAGYALCVGIAILGTTAGLTLGEHYQNKAVQEMTRAHRQEYLLTDLQISVLQARTHASRFAVVLGNSVWLQYERNGFNQSINHAKQLLTQTERFVLNPENRALVETRELQNSLKRYAITVDAYKHLSESLLKQIDAENLKPMELMPAQQHLLNNSSGEVAIALDQLSKQLSQSIETAQAQHRRAAVTLEHASALRVKIIAASMLLSIAIAALLAWYTSNAIVQPIRNVTSVARQVAEESNFALRAPITTCDEIGVLATSLNQLIERIAAYTQELKQAQAQLIQTEKMSSLGAMVAGVAHEINNPVNFIYGNLDYAGDYIQDLLSLLYLYQQHYPEPLPEIQNQLEAIDFDFLAEDLPKVLSSMKVGANRIREIVLSLRNFSRLDEAGMKPVNIHEGIENTLLILNSRFKQGIQLIKEYGELPLVECSPAQLNQVFMNLLCNALDALEELNVGRLKVESSEDNLQPATQTNLQPATLHQPTTPCIRIRTEVSDQNWVAIRIVDNGSGISPTILDRIFDPFFTTKEPGKGTGLGLTISYQIISQHCGKIEVKSTQNQGTEFVIKLPTRASRSVISN
jgi:signal transduction histidine kinase